MFKKISGLYLLTESFETLVLIPSFGIEFQAIVQTRLFFYCDGFNLQCFL